MIELKDNFLDITLNFKNDVSSFGNQIPVQFCVKGTDLLGTVYETGIVENTLPLLVPAFATLGVASLRVAEKIGWSVLELDDYGSELIFKKNDSLIKIKSTRTGVTVEVDYLELLTVWQSFGKLVKNIVIERNPEKKDYLWWCLLDEYPPPNVEKILYNKDILQDRGEDS